MKDGGAAFPYEEKPDGRFWNGMTLRDYFAGQALVGIMTSAAINPKQFLEAAQQISKEEKKQYTLSELVSINSYAVADFMLAERENKQ